MEVLVDVGALGDGPAELLESAVLRTLREAGARDAEISLTLLDDAGMRALNQSWLGRDRFTDVIAFSLGDEPLVGDVYVGLEQARRQADELGVELHEELVRLAIHGTLHVLGHEHPEGEERVTSPMFALQERLVQEVMGRR